MSSFLHNMISLTLFCTVCTPFCHCDPICILNPILHLLNIVKVKAILCLISYPLLHLVFTNMIVHAKNR